MYYYFNQSFKSIRRYISHLFELLNSRAIAELIQLDSSSFSYRAVWILGHKNHQRAAAVAKWPQLWISIRTVYRVDVTAVAEKKSNVTFATSEYVGESIFGIYKSRDDVARRHKLENCATERKYQPDMPKIRATNEITTIIMDYQLPRPQFLLLSLIMNVSRYTNDNDEEYCYCGTTGDAGCLQHYSLP